MYDNEFSHDDIKFNNKSRKINSFFKSAKFLLLIIVVLVVIIIGFSIYNKNIKYRNSYKYIEDRLVEEAKVYVKTNKMENNQEFYIEAKKLNIALKDNCYSVSGVLVNGNNYQPYLMCSDYETKFDNKENEYIKLNGRNILFLNKGNEYKEAYYEKLSDVSVNIEGNIGLQEGVYNVNYMIENNNSFVEKITRKVIILDNKEIDDFYPKITLNGEKIEYLELNDNYVEKGANGFDSDDGIISDIKIIGEVNNKEVGEYDLSYVVINSNGYVSSIVRKVVVVNSEISINYIISPPLFTKDKVLIHFGVHCDNYDYTILPNNEISYEKNIQYEVSENGNYNFKVYAKNETFKEEIVEIKNIDLDKPVGTCTGYYLENKSYITVTASDNGSGIDKYVIDKFDYKSNTITVSGELKSVNIDIYDKVGNYSNISCQLEDKNPVTSACNDRTIYPGNKYVFTQEQKEKMAAMVSTEADGSPREAVDYLGMKLVASHMCNYYEKLYPNEEWSGKRLHWLITISNWYSELTKKSKFKPDNPRHQLALKAVEEVMVNGNRILPHYIDEFDWFPHDVKNPLSNVEDYVRDETIYYGYGWIKVTFWCINIGPDGRSGNIFGYTKKPTTTQ